MPLADDQKQEPILTCAACGHKGKRGRELDDIAICIANTPLCGQDARAYMDAFDSDAPSIEAERQRFLSWVKALANRRGAA